MNKEEENNDSLELEDRIEEIRQLEEFLSNFSDRRAGLAAASLGLSVERAHRAGYR